MKRLMILALLLGVSASVPATQAQDVYARPEAQSYRMADPRIIPQQPLENAASARKEDKAMGELVAEYQPEPQLDRRVSDQLNRQLMRFSYGL